MNDHSNTIIEFINRIGITCKPCNLMDDTFLPGIDIKNGTVWYDPEKMKYPGDLLHEAGHVAVLLPQDRKTVSGPNDINGDLQAGGAEMAAIAWSWAALTHLNLPPETVFHPEGYKSGSTSLIENFTNEQYMGHYLLAWMGMTTVAPADQTSKVYPAMEHWLRPDNSANA